MRVAYLFSGQGQQFDDMGIDLYQNEPAFREIIDQASNILGMDFSDSQVINDPKNVQLAVSLMSLGTFQVLNQLGLKDVAHLGLSLGEYGALITSGALSLEQGLRLIKDRGHYMEVAGEKNPGKMMAVLNASDAQVKSAMKAAQEIGPVYVANVNTPKQIVVGGDFRAMSEFQKSAKGAGIKRVVPLKMTVASHTPLMNEAKDQLEIRLRDVEFSTPEIPVLSNTTMEPFELDEIKETLANQLIQTTHFSECLGKIAEYQPDLLLEVGPGKALTGFVKKTLKDVPVMHVDSVETLAEARNFIAQKNED
ncbi:ACP S-malonyltransferase [Pediococcus claussenii]|uniref:Malonyl CoA-acyl carrier protein transacylase n=1 Tax=Pediococcus claussenii (strain ATCC BAA-344 / DSM 14800 / JCM 18046 / KCTC 3811 / LMG 21948 / P06) TaxID=701521 RepID=G8PEQ5_PEDCP|nr:ACP S-malonyltransferase [Pediococcus claussenii]AEV94435.1 malonyl CoA-acyl carrier protein transacylase [Pediococcus claussenii ATCC BAA-344]ANZ69654.1 ACP S-malonyltransferase [Pediococcus claussenii]ANZ71471.1 ACP S-malonyltransferase [Pediococcus claussenii]KRN19861.1 fabD protein [Pediococcus claussenii]